jgi:hypothetical protein
MAVRLHMNLGVVAESQRLPDSADTAVVVEPNIGSTSRTKGSLFLLVTGDGGKELREATRLVADRIRDDYYYDLSAGISVCLRKAVRNANNVLLHAPQRPDVAEGSAPPIGLAVAVVRGNELYVASLGPAEAYLIRQARLLTLPDADVDSAIPSPDLEGPEVWHGEIAMGDCLVLVSPNVTRRVGLEPLQDAVGQLHPQAAVDQLHRQFGSGSLGSTGGDGIVVIEATEVPSTLRAQPLKPVWPNESRAGAVDHSPIPLADTVAGAVAAVQASAHHVGASADNWLRRGAYNLFDRMPQRGISRGRVTPMTVRRERQQRAALAVIGLLAITAVLGTSIWFLGGSSQADRVDAQTLAQQAYAAAKSDVDRVYGTVTPMTESDPPAAAALLKDAYAKLQVAAANGYSNAKLDAEGLQSKVVAGLNDWYGVVTVTPHVVATFAGNSLDRMVLGPDGAAYVIDSTTASVYWVNLKTGAKIEILAKGQEINSNTVGNPRAITTGGQDVLVLDDFNSIWRWRPAASDNTGRGTWKKVVIPDNATWGLGTVAIGTFVVNEQQGFYNIYVIVPKINQILRYPPASDGSSYPANGRAKYLAVDQDVSKVQDMYVDGDIYLLGGGDDGGKLTQWELGQKTKWTVDPPGSSTAEPEGDTLLRPKGTYYKRVAADNASLDQGNFYAYDTLYRRIVKFTKSSASFEAQYMVAANQPWFSDVTGLFVIPGKAGASDTLYWIESGTLLSASLTAAGSSASPSPGSSASASASAKASR